MMLLGRASNTLFRAIMSVSHRPTPARRKDGQSRSEPNEARIRLTIVPWQSECNAQQTSSLLRCWRKGVWPPSPRLKWHLCKAVCISNAWTNLRPHSSKSEERGAAATSCNNTRSKAWSWPDTIGSDVVCKNIANLCTSSAGSCHVSASSAPDAHSVATAAAPPPSSSPPPPPLPPPSSSLSPKETRISNRSRRIRASKSSSSSPNSAEAVSPALDLAAGDAAAAVAAAGALPELPAPSRATEAA
mmetsp:Transcript_118012/g.306389  ORF Transcript_118012/g.306389 Transcript_118012/m.306389 type:complete len:245 (+) Transcript_118012:123-857(+)